MFQECIRILLLIDRKVEIRAHDYYTGPEIWKSAFVNTIDIYRNPYNIVIDLANKM